MEEPQRNEESEQGDEALVREEEQAAAEQAGEIGGAGGADEVTDEAERPLAEAGQGESEGFELAEQELIDKSESGKAESSEIEGE